MPIFFLQLSQPAFLDKVDQRASLLAWSRSAKSTKQRIQHSVKTQVKSLTDSFIDH